MDLKDIVHALIDTYEKIDKRLVITKSAKESKLAFLKISFSGDQNINKKNIDFFNSLSNDLLFIQDVQDISCVNSLINSLQKGILETTKQSYSISEAERNYFNEDIPTKSLYSKWTSDLYVRQHSEDNFRSLLMRPFSTTTCGGILSSCNIPNKIKGFETSKIINAFLDSSSIDNVNSRIVILLPVYSMLRQILSQLEVVVHKALINDISLQFLNGDPKTVSLSEIVKCAQDGIISYHVEKDLLKNYSQLSLYSNSLDLELDKKEIHCVPPIESILPNYIQYDSNENLMLPYWRVNQAKP